MIYSIPISWAKVLDGNHVCDRCSLKVEEHKFHDCCGMRDCGPHDELHCKGAATFDRTCSERGCLHGHFRPMASDVTRRGK